MNDKYRVLQDDLKDCGICSLLSIIKFYGGNVTKEYLRDETKTNNNGVNALNLLNCARKLGFEAYGVKGKINDINLKVLPIIAHVVIDKKYPHFVVIYKVNVVKDKILVMDPARGFVSLTISKFMNIATGYYLILKPKGTIPKLENHSSYFIKIKGFIIHYKKVFLLIFAMSLIYVIINIINSYHFKILYELNNNNLLLMVIFLIILINFKDILNYFRNNLLIMFNTLLDKHLVKDAFYHIINLPYLYYRNHTNGDLLTRINDLGNIKELLSNLFIGVFVDLILAIIVLVFMFRISSQLSLISLGMLLLYGIIALLSGKSLNPSIRDNYEKSSLTNNSLMESLSSFETIKNLSIQNYVFNKFSSKYNEYIETNENLFRKIQIESFFKNIVLDLGNLIILYLGIMMINNKIITIASLITYLSLSNYLIDPVRKLLDLHLEYQNTKESLRRIKELYGVKKENLTFSNRSFKYLTGNIDISDVSYSYNGRENILNHLSLSINEGEKVLIYGNSGSGKSSLMKLLTKYLDNTYEGSITIGGYDLLDIDLATLRHNICYVSQNEYLYTDSVYQNITLGKRIKYHSFLDIANNLMINEIVKNSSVNYDMILENNGANISGGERKRIMVARSILQKANIYIYDETFSEMDITLERRILMYLFKKYPAKTFIIISHRFSNEDLFNKKILIGEEVNVTS